MLSLAALFAFYVIWVWLGQWARLAGRLRDEERPLTARKERTDQH